MKILLTVLILLCLFLFFPKPAPVHSEYVAPLSLEEKIDRGAVEHNLDPLLAKAIIQCESENNPKAKNDNYTKKGIYWSSDHGYWQLNDYWHEDTAKDMGLDIYSENDNLKYGFLLMQKNGTKDWNASKHCWSKLI